MASLKEKTDKAQEIYSKFKALNSAKIDVYWRQAEMLYKLKKDNLYKFVFGDNEQTWASFLSEIGVPNSSANQKISNWDFFINKHGMKIEDLKVDTSSLYYITNGRKDSSKEDVEEAIHMAQTLSRGDFVQNIKGDAECSHGETIEASFYKCKDCGRKLSRFVEKNVQ